ncbi:MAG: hypothetical protein DSO00_04115 [Archaeoglobi archaeon]|nr:MAG: hypothetical protein DSO00_04115 [Archaeoglobi archaeon]
MWLRLATSEDKEKLLEMAADLRRSGARIEIRELIEWEEDELFFISGKLSELRKISASEKLRGEIEKWERRITVLRKILKKGEVRYEEFLESFMKSEDPEVYESAKKLMAEDLDAEDLVSFAENAIKIGILMDELQLFLDKNGIEVGEFVRGNLPDDPEVTVILEEPVEGARNLVVVDYFPLWELYVDVLSLLGEEVDDRVLGCILAVISNILLNVEKVEDIEKLRELSSSIIDGENGEILINCEEIFETIVRSLEKAGIVRVSGKKIKIRRGLW